MQNPTRLFMATMIFLSVCADLAIAQTVPESAGTIEQEAYRQAWSSAEESIVHAVPSIERRAASELAGFSWVVSGELAAMPLPGAHRPLIEDADFLHSEGIRTLISLTEIAPDPEVLAAARIEQAHIPVKDFTAPTIAQIDEFVAIVRASVADGEAVGVHCTAGLGRSGTMAAAYLVAAGASAEDAMTTVRQLRPGSIETELQEAAVRQYESHLSR